MRDKVSKGQVDKKQVAYEAPQCKSIVYKGGLRMGCGKGGSGGTDRCDCGYQYCGGTIS